MGERIHSVQIDGVEIPVRRRKLRKKEQGFYKYRAGPVIEINERMNAKASAMAVLHESLEAASHLYRLGLTENQICTIEMVVTGLNKRTPELFAALREEGS